MREARAAMPAGQTVAADFSMQWSAVRLVPVFASRGDAQRLLYLWQQRQQKYLVARARARMR